MKKIIYLAAIVVVATFQMGCKKKKPAPTVQETGTMTDIEGNTYKTIKIGNQWWMAENLKTKTYRNGKPLLQAYVTDPDSVWANYKQGAYCKYPSSEDYFKTYGLLYNGYVVFDTNNIAPKGWHIASDAEWKALEINLGMSASDTDKSNWRGSNQGDKLKVASPLGWTTFGTIWSTNESGFSALGGSCRMFNGTWGSPGTYSTGFWWTSSINTNNNETWYRHLDYKNSTVFRYFGSKNYGMNIRCVKD